MNALNSMICIHVTGVPHQPKCISHCADLQIYLVKDRYFF